MKSTGNADVAEFFSIMLMSVLIGLNTYTIFSFVYVLSGVSVDISPDPKLFSVLVFLGLLILFYILLVRRNKYLDIVKEFEHETSQKKIIGIVIAIAYILISLGLLMLCVYLMMQRNRGLI